MNSFENIKWFPDRMVYNDQLYRLEHYKSDNWEDGPNYFTFYKIKKLVDQYEHYFRRSGDSGIKNLFELGVYGGGSIAFWNDFLMPDVHIGIDIKDVVKTPYLEGYLNKKVSEGKVIQILTGIDQANKGRLKEIYNTAFDGPLDMVIDDASHLYNPTKSSFEALFPLLRPGGIYIIEDWAWGHWEDFFSPDHFWADQIPPTKLIHQLTELAGTDSTIIKSICIYEGFTAIERGDSKKLDDSFLIESFIKRRPQFPSKTTSGVGASFIKRTLRSVKSIVKPR